MGYVFGFFGLEVEVAGEEGNAAAVGRPPPSSPAGLAVRMMTEMMKKLHNNFGIEGRERVRTREWPSLSLSKFVFYVVMVVVTWAPHGPLLRAPRVC